MALRKEVFEGGTGKYPRPGNTVVVHWTGYGKNGDLGLPFASTEDENAPLAFIFGYSGQIKALDDAVRTMRQGERSAFICPSTLAFGETGHEEYGVLPNSMIGLEIELLRVDEYISAEELVTIKAAASSSQASLVSLPSQSVVSSTVTHNRFQHHKLYAAYKSGSAAHHHALNPYAVHHSSHQPRSLKAKAKTFEAQFSGPMKRLKFEKGSFKLTEKSMTIIKRVAGMLQEVVDSHAGATIMVEGHTDSHNMPLSQGRADAVKQAFITAGIPGKQITAKGFSNTRPLPPPANSKRVEVKII